MIRLLLERQHGVVGDDLCGTASERFLIHFAAERSQLTPASNCRS